MDKMPQTEVDAVREEDVQLRFCEYVQFLHSCIGGDRGRAEYVEYLTSLFLREMTDEELQKEQDNEAVGQNNKMFNPMSGKNSKSTLVKIYTGEQNRKISRRDARTLLQRFDDSAFKQEFEKVEVAARKPMVEKLATWGITTTVYTLDQSCSEIYRQFLEAMSRGKDVLDLLVTPTKKTDKIPSAEVIGKQAYVREGKLYVGGMVIELPEELTVREDIAEHELPYVNALYAAYEDAEGHRIKSREDLEGLHIIYRKNFSEQMRAYYAAEGMRRSVSEVFLDGDNQFELLKEDAYTGIYETYWDFYDNGFKRLQAVLIKITNTRLDKSTLSLIQNLLDDLVRKGVCHILVNDGLITSWVIKDE